MSLHNLGILGRKPTRNGILAQPPNVDENRTCPHCNSPRSLLLQREDFNPVGRRVSLYLCIECDREVSFAKGHPPGAV